MDNDLVAELYMRYYRELYLYLYSLCGSREYAEDILQETFVKALLALPENTDNIRGWLFVVARNTFLYDKRKCKETVSLEQAEEASSDEDHLAGMIRNERQRILYQGLKMLSAQKREVLVLQYWSGLSGKEIAKLLRITPENVRVLSARGKKQLKKYMEDNGYDF